MKRESFQTILDTLTDSRISLVTGARQVGKTTLVKQVRRRLKEQKQQVTFLNLENKRFRSFLDQDPENIFQLIPSLYKQKRQYLILDEIQLLSDPSNFLKYIYDRNVLVHLYKKF